MSTQIALWATWNATSSNDYSKKDEAKNLNFVRIEILGFDSSNLPQ
jgi:hypothetical protein